MLVVVAKFGIAMAEQKGLLAKRVDMQTISYRSMSGVVLDETLYASRRGEMAVQGMVGGSAPAVPGGLELVAGRRRGCTAGRCRA